MKDRETEDILNSDTEKDEPFQKAMMADVPSSFLHKLEQLSVKSVEKLAIVAGQLSLYKYSRGVTRLPAYRKHLLDYCAQTTNSQLAEQFEHLDEKQLCVTRAFLISLYSPERLEKTRAQRLKKTTFLGSAKKRFRQMVEGITI